MPSTDHNFMNVCYRIQWRTKLFHTFRNFNSPQLNKKKLPGLFFEQFINKILFFVFLQKVSNVVILNCQFLRTPWLLAANGVRLSMVSQLCINFPQWSEINPQSRSHGPHCIMKYLGTPKSDTYFGIRVGRVCINQR